MVIFLQYVKKNYCNCYVFYCDAKHSDILRGSSHVRCYLFTVIFTWIFTLIFTWIFTLFYVIHFNVWSDVFVNVWKVEEIICQSTVSVYLTDTTKLRDLPLKIQKGGVWRLDVFWTQSLLSAIVRLTETYLFSFRLYSYKQMFYQ